MAEVELLKIAFLIAAHNDIEHLRKLVPTLQNHDIFIHWDAKSGIQPQIDNVTFTSKRISVFWAGFSQVDATMELIQAALNKGEKYDKYVLLSGSCFPIKPIYELENLFRNDGNKNYLKAIKVADADFMQAQVVKNIWRDAILPLNIKRTDLVQKIERIIRFGLNKILNFTNKKSIDMEIYHGSNWWALNHESILYALKVYKDCPEVVKFFKFTFASDEKIFHTVIRNSIHVNECDEYSEFTGRGTYKMANLHIVDPSLAKWFTLKDYEQICKSDKFFVRKVRTQDGSELVEKIMKELLQ